MKKAIITLSPVTQDMRERFILDNQWAFKKAAMEGLENDGEQEGEIIERSDIEASLDGENCHAFLIMADGQYAGGIIVRIDPETMKNSLEILFVRPDVQSRGAGSGAWKEIEKMYPETVSWETVTPYFDKRNVHFYVNKCGFRIVEFFCESHPDPVSGETFEMFRFLKEMK